MDLVIVRRHPVRGTRGARGTCACGVAPRRRCAWCALRSDRCQCTHISTQGSMRSQSVGSGVAWPGVAWRGVVRGGVAWRGGGAGGGVRWGVGGGGWGVGGGGWGGHRARAAGHAHGRHAHGHQTRPPDECECGCGTSHRQPLRTTTESRSSLSSAFSRWPRVTVTRSVSLRRAVPRAVPVLSSWEVAWSCLCLPVRGRPTAATAAVRRKLRGDRERCGGWDS